MSTSTYLNKKTPNGMSTDTSSESNQFCELSTGGEPRSSLRKERDEPVSKAQNDSSNEKNTDQTTVRSPKDAPKEAGYQRRKRIRPNHERRALDNRNLQTPQELQRTEALDGNLAPPQNQVVSETLPFSHPHSHHQYFRPPMPPMPPIPYPRVTDLAYRSVMPSPGQHNSLQPMAGFHQPWAMQVQNQPFQNFFQLSAGDYIQAMNPLPVMPPAQSLQTSFPTATADTVISNNEIDSSRSDPQVEEVLSSNIEIDQQETAASADQGTYIPSIQLPGLAAFVNPVAFVPSYPLVIAGTTPMGTMRPEAIPTTAAVIPEAQQYSLAFDGVEISRSEDGSTLLYMPCDDGHLSEYQCLIRQQLEIFEATEQDITQSMQGRKKQLYVGQVGVRCIHCKDLPLPERGRGSVYFPAKLDRFYQAAQNMASTHLCLECKAIDRDIMDRLGTLRGDRAVASGGKRYWADSVKVQGCYEDIEDGVRRYPSSALFSTSFGPNY